MTKRDEARIRREGFPINEHEARSLLDFIELYDRNHDAIEPEIVVKLELLSKNIG